MQDIPLTELANLGVSGLAVYLLYRLLSNHLSHTTKALEELKSVIMELRNFFKNGK